MKYFTADVFQSIISFFESLKSGISLENLLFIFVGLEILTIITFVIIVHNVYELRLVRAIDKINMYLYEVKTINESNLVEFNNLMKRVPKTLRYHWQQYMLNRDKNPSFYMSVENCIDRPLKSSSFKTNIKIVKILGFVYAGLSFLFACGWASSLGPVNSDLFITIFAIPIIVILINYIFVIGLNIRMSSNASELYQTFHIFNRFIDKAVVTMPEFVDFEVLFTENEIRRGIPVLNEYIEKRQRQEEEELKKERENAIQHEAYEFKVAGDKGELVLERAMKEAETFVGMRNRVDLEIESLEKEIENLKRNFESITKEYQKKLQASKENSERLREQQEATTNRIESNYIKKQQSDEFKKQQQIENDQESAKLKFNQELNKLSAIIEEKKIEIEEGKVYLEKAMLAEYNTFANKIYNEIRNDVNKKFKEEKNQLIASRDQAVKDLEEVVEKADLLEKQNKILVGRSDEREAYIKAEIGKEKRELEKLLKQKDEIINERDKQIKLLTDNYKFEKNDKKKEEAFEKYDEFGGYYDSEGNYRYKNGTYYDANGNFHDEKENVYDREGNLISGNFVENEIPAVESLEENKKNEIVEENNNNFEELSITEASVSDFDVEDKEEDNNLEEVLEKQEPAKKRGRPRKEKVEVVSTESKKRGRPRKVVDQTEISTEPKKRGRPRKEKEEIVVNAEPKKRGRPKKVVDETVVSTEPKKRGRPRKEKEEVVVNAEPKKRGRPRKIDIDENLKMIEERLKEQNELLKQQQKALEITVNNVTKPTEE